MELSGLDALLEHVEQQDAITLPYRGRAYVVPRPGTARTLRCAALLAAYRLSDDERAAAVEKALAGDRVEDLIVGVEVAERLHADDVPAPVIQYMVTVALIAWVQGETAAQSYIDAKAAGEKGPKARARSTQSTTGMSTDAASTTRARASTSGTKRRPSGSRKVAAAAPAKVSTGGQSSPAGTS